jgi:DNA invertase Pin-like site-specific DNA recombinase
MPKNAAVYLRVSTEEQSKHWGVQAQLSSCKKYCRENKLAIPAVYTDIISGGTSNRPGFQQMLIDAKQKSFSMIVVAKLDRLARDLYLQIGTIEVLRGHGVGVVSVAEPLGAGDEASNTLIRNIFGSFGQYEKDKIKGRLRGGALAKAREGKYAGGRPPYGYMTSSKKTLIPDVAKIDVIRKVFSLNSRKYSLSEIADELNGQGWVTTTGKPWRKQAVDRILKDKLFYRGHYAYGDIEAKGQHEAILR